VGDWPECNCYSGTSAVTDAWKNRFCTPEHASSHTVHGLLYLVTPFVLKVGKLPQSNQFPIDKIKSHQFHSYRLYAPEKQECSYLKFLWYLYIFLWHCCRKSN